MRRLSTSDAATPVRLRLARLVCSRMPPVGAQKVRELIYPRTAAQSDDHWFTVRAQTGSLFTGTTADHIGYPFAVHRYYNWRNIAIAKVVCQAGDTIVEVGANVGSETVGFSDIVGERGVVHAFEPFTSNLEQLRANAARTRHGNVNVWPVALSDHDGHVRFVAPWAYNSGSGHVVREADEASATSASDDVVEIPCVTLDSLLPQLGPARLMAIDAEGHEMAILLGAGKYLRTYQPLIIIEVLESRLAASGATPEDVAQHLRRLGYDLFEIGRFGTRTIGEDKRNIPRMGDWVAVPTPDHGVRERIDRALRRCALMPMMRGLNPLCAR